MANYELQVPILTLRYIFSLIKLAQVDKHGKCWHLVSGNSIMSVCPTLHFLMVCVCSGSSLKKSQLHWTAFNWFDWKAFFRWTCTWQTVKKVSVGSTLTLESPFCRRLFPFPKSFTMLLTMNSALQLSTELFNTLYW